MITAAKRGVTAEGIEYNPKMVELSKQNAEKEKVSARASFKEADLFQSDFSKATVLTMFLLSDINLRLRPTILKLKPGTRVVSNTFDMGDWKADQTFSADDKKCTSYCRAYLWYVPAQVEGTWTSTRGDLTLKQTYQMLTGTLKKGKTDLPISDAKMNGRQITFKAGGRNYVGTVDGDKIVGRTTLGKKGMRWLATKAKA